MADHRGQTRGISPKTARHSDCARRRYTSLFWLFVTSSAPPSCSASKESATFRFLKPASSTRLDAAVRVAAGKDNSAPSLRPDDHPHCYGAFVIDMEGNNMGAVCHRPEQAAHRNSVSSDGRIYIRIA